MNKFKIGDKVVGKGIMSNYNIEGLIGTVRVVLFVYEYKDAVGVEFDEPFNAGHPLNATLNGGSRRGYWVYPQFLDFLNENFKIGDEVQVEDTLIKGKVTEINSNAINIEGFDGQFLNEKVSLIGRRKLV